ncbi:unnamed protein product [Caenorhabditis bovis]|uniref:SAND domain-containing protein n=1 Tax=Caenorhabditis bovis TaxID=2654633 RepID=A0A8S1EG92_9PELO|nr:unnamed protein product [Caenorhabditis bovis]
MTESNTATEVSESSSLSPQETKPQFFTETEEENGSDVIDSNAAEAKVFDSNVIESKGFDRNVTESKVFDSKDSNSTDINVKNEYEIPNIIPIKCGPLTARMHVEFFVCPGIHQPCIELEGEPGLITPKAFTIKANKDKQKDWKGSIRIGKSNLRTLMEMRTFDFHNHANFCSAKCQSRNYITPKERDATPTDGRRGSLTSRLPFTPTPPLFPTDRMPQSSSSLKTLFKNPQFTQLVSQALRNNNNFGSNTENLSNPIYRVPKEEIVDVDDSMVNSNSVINSATATSSLLGNIPHDVDALNTQMNTEPSVFWAEMTQCGLADGIIDQMIETMNSMREKLKNGNVNNVAPFLSRAIASLGVCDKVISMVRRRNSLSLNAKHRLSTDYSSMEDNMSRKRSIDDGPSSLLEALTVKRPCVRYPVPFQGPSANSASENLEAIATLLQMQQMQTQSPSEMLMQLAASIQPQNVNTPHLSDALLAIK